MKLNIKSIAAAILTAGIMTSAALADSVATQTVNFEVSAISELEVSGSPGALVVSTATAGSAPNSVSDSSTSYAITTNETNRKITGSLDANMPSGVTLTVDLSAPTGGSSAGVQALSTTAADLVTGISTLNESGLGISYELSATSAAGVVAPASRTVTLTIVAGA